MSLSVSDAELEKLSATLLNTSGTVPLAKRFRALFTLKGLAPVNEEAVRIIAGGTCE
jgi:deoxyhypusine monooxygenase